MAMNFVAATDALFARTGPEELADELGCAPNSVRQARMDAGKKGYRAAPPGWEAAVARLARQKAAQLLKLADRLA